MEVLTNVCRICLMPNDLESIYEITIEGKTIPEILASCANVLIEPSDNFSKGICPSCIKKLTEVCLFLNICKESNDVLHYTLNQLGKEQIEVRMPPMAPKKENMESLEEKSQNLVIYVNMGNTGGDIQLENLPVQEEDPSKLEEEPVLYLNCNECDLDFSSLYEISLHYKAIEHDDNVDYCCPVCKLIFQSCLSFTNHVDRHVHDIHKCTVCGKMFSHFRALKSHMVLHVGKPSSYAILYQNDNTTKEDRKTPKIMEIRRIIDKKKNFKCDVCDKMFASEMSLKTHSNVHLDPEFVCSICNKMFHNKYKLSEHIKEHNEVRRFHCGICKKEFKKLVNLKAHKLIHQGVKPHKCPVCDRCFTQQQQLKSHMRTHTKEKPFTCEFCSKSFALKGNLVVHRRIHTLEFPYRCDHCSNGYPDSTSLKRHLTAHEKNKTATVKTVRKNEGNKTKKTPISEVTTLSSTQITEYKDGHGAVCTVYVNEDSVGEDKPELLEILEEEEGEEMIFEEEDSQEVHNEDELEEEMHEMHEDTDNFADVNTKTEYEEPSYVISE